MPLYVYECAPCSKQRSEMRRMAERRVGPACDVCGFTMKLVLSATPGIVRNPAVPRSGK